MKASIEEAARGHAARAIVRERIMARRPAVRGAARRSNLSILTRAIDALRELQPNAWRVDEDFDATNRAATRQTYRVLERVTGATEPAAAAA